MASILPTFRTALQAFASSPSSFQVLRTIPSFPIPPSPKIIYVLDSSFNPPTLAHFHIAASALESSGAARSSKRLLLLLATQNADKPSKPAAFEHRLAMMTLFAEDLIESLSPTATDGSSVAVDIGITKHPIFIDKCSAITSSGTYQEDPSRTGQVPIEQVHLVGYDTLIRLLNPKYYPSTKDLSPLQGLFQHHRFRVTYRADDGWGGRQEQDKYLQDLSDGKREPEGGQKSWADKITMVEGSNAGEKAISSTRIRDALQNGDSQRNIVNELCTERVAGYLLEEMPYRAQSEEEDN
ncbi:hypothetical protein MMC19_004780 [Ptychographa xylographoides]|nr:hypothetical protein [Ptychographa xylographoides]